MAEKQIQSIIFKSMERFNERINANDGACEEIINLRPKGNTWQNIFPRKLKERINIGQDSNLNDLVFGEYQIINHPASQDKYRIIWAKNENTNKVILYTYNSVADEWQFSRILFDNGEKIISVTYLDNILTICTENDKYFYLYKDNDYLPLNLSSLRPTLKSEGISLPNDHRGYSYHKLNDGSTKIATFKCNTGADFGGLNWLTGGEVELNNPYYLQDNTYHPEHLPAIFKQCLQQDEELKWDGITPSNRICGLSLFRVAIELADGSFTQYSNIDFADPIRKNPLNNKEIYGDGISIFFRPSSVSSKATFDASPYIVNIPNLYGFDRININLRDVATLQSLMRIGVIKNVSLFMTPPVLAYDVDDYDNYKTFWAWNNDEHKVNRRALVGEGEDFYSSSSANHTENRVILPINKQIFEVFKNGAFYRVKTFDLEFLQSGANRDLLLNPDMLQIDLYASDIKNLTANTPLPTPNASEDNKVLFSSSYTYNRQQHLFNLFYSMFKGVAPLDYKNVIDGTDNHTSFGDFYYSFSGKYNEHNFTVSSPLHSDFVTIDNGNITINIPRKHLFFQYPMLSNIVFSVWAKRNNQKLLIYKDDTLTEHAGQNSSFALPLNSKSFTQDKYFDYLEANNIPATNIGNDSIIKDIDFTLSISNIQANDYEPLDEDNGTIHLTNVLQLTETDNPLITPNKENYSFGENDNKIVAVISNTGTQATTDRNFGLYPLYVFTTDGIYVMQVGSGDTAYSSIHKINDEVIISPYTCNTPAGIVFLSKSGLYILSQNGMDNIGRVMDGKPTLTRLAQENFYNFLSEINTRIIIPHNQTEWDRANEDEDYEPQLLTLNDIVFQEWLSCTFTNNDFLSEEVPNHQIYYDTTHREIVFCIRGTYSYCYNLEYKSWYKRGDCYYVDDPKTLSKYAYEIDEIKQKTITYIYLYNIEEDTADITSALTRRPHIITKPLLLDTRNYQHLERIIFNLAWRTGTNDFWLFIFGSNDGAYYNILKYTHQTPDSDNANLLKQDYYFSRTLRSHKYIFLCIFSNHLYPTRIGNVLFLDRQQRYLAGIK